MKHKFTKQEFRDLMDLNIIDLRQNDTCMYKGNLYNIVCIDEENIVELEFINE